MKRQPGVFLLALSFWLLPATSSAKTLTKSRWVVRGRTIQLNRALKVFLKAHKYHVIKEISSHQNVLRAFAVSMNGDEVRNLRDQFGYDDVFISLDKKMEPPVYSRNVPDGGGIVSSLNLWGPMRILGHLPPRSRAKPNQGTLVCVSDTGINWLHPRLRDGVVAEFNAAYDPLNTKEGFLQAYPEFPNDYPREDRNVYCRSGNDLVPCGYDDDGHGSHVAGIIGAREIDDGPNTDIVGIDPNARLIAAKGLGWHYVPNPFFHPIYAPEEPRFVYEYFGYYSDLAVTIWLCLLSNVSVINMSWGGGDSDIVHAALADAASMGKLLVAAAGNEYDPTTGVGPVLYPARYPEVISVSALGLDGKIAPFSSRGSKIDFIAPGVSILSTTLQSGYLPGLDTGTYSYYSGTSMAAPHVTGVVSRMFSTAPYTDRRDLVGIDIGLARFEQGEHGLINAELSCRL